mmetsp:Transcript_9046/g.12833  ORF Transcript_9046/g.12833 Transcript_9046/m.12833 type:complete len:152 (-) Transcript_9046:91-546(-)
MVLPTTNAVGLPPRKIVTPNLPKIFVPKSATPHQVDLRILLVLNAEDDSFAHLRLLNQNALGATLMLMWFTKLMILARRKLVFLKKEKNQAEKVDLPFLSTHFLHITIHLRFHADSRISIKPQRQYRFVKREHQERTSKSNIFPPRLHYFK